MLHASPATTATVGTPQRPSGNAFTASAITTARTGTIGNR